MKHLFMGLALYCLSCGSSHAQTSELNQQKYWKLRNSFKEQFIKIGSHVGESQPAGILKPFDCVDNINSDGSGYGEMHWGDGTIRHGHYLTLLATEYRLLINSQQYEQAQATLNELYYALNTIFRLDLNAEPNQGLIYENNVIATFDSPINGFYNREDINEDFATDNWGSDPMEMRCTNSAFYHNNNAAKVNSGGYFVKGNSYQNVPSLDQMSSLLVGLSMVVNLVGPGQVAQPTPQDVPKDIQLFAKDQIYWIITYASKNNWFLMDINGWPVNNGGGDLLICGYPIKRIFERHWNSSINTVAIRKFPRYDKIREVVTGYGLEAESNLTVADLNMFQQAIYNEIMIEEHLCSPQLTGHYTNSRFMQWQNCGQIFDVDALSLFWHNFIPNRLDDMYEDYLPDHKFDLTFAGTPNYSGFGYIEFDKLNWAEGNNSILFNLGVAAGIWDGIIADDWATATGNRELELINSVLNGYDLAHQAGYYKSYLDSMTFAGPYDLEGAAWNNALQTNTNYKQKYHEGGWGGEYRWTNKSQIYSEGEKGIYSGMDYMIFYNLYHLKFGSVLPAYQESWTCNCNPITATGPINEPADQDAYNNLNDKLQYVNSCQPNVFYPVNNMVISIFDIEPKFDNYPEMGIYTTKYQTQNAAVLPTGDINVRTRFVVCNGSTLNVQAGGRIDVEVKEMIVNTDGTVNNSGVILVRQGTQLVLKSGSKLILRNGSKLRIEEGAKLVIEEGATVEYYNGAEIVMIGAGSEIVHGGTIKTMDQTTFSIGSESTTNQKGKYTINSPNTSFVCEQPAYIYLEGKNIDDPFITINDGAKLYIQDQDIIRFRIADCQVEMKSGSNIVTEEPVYSYNVRYYSFYNNGGFTMTDENNFINSHFVNVPVKANLNVENISPFVATNCSFEHPITNLNLSDNSLVKVTGMGVGLTNCSFKGNRSYCLNTFGLTQPSSATGCTFVHTAASATNSNLVGINDVSNIEFKVIGSDFQKCLTGIYKSNGKLSLKCNTFKNNNLSNVKVRSGCLLNMSINDFAGYNMLFKSLQNKSIEITSCNINLKNGYNFIETCTATIAGSTMFTCVPPGCQVDLANNQWNTANTVPATSLFQITSSNSMAVLPLVNTIAAKPACGFYDGPIVIDPPKTKSTFAQDGMPIIWSVIENDSIRLNEAIIGGMELMTSYDSVNGNDLQALARFNEVFASDVNPHDSLTRNYLWYTFDHMKTTLENAYAHGQLQINSNATDFEPEVAIFANALMLMTDSVIDEENYLTQFYHEIDKAHLFRVIGRSDIGLNILTELESCGLDSAEQAHLNQWKMVFSEDLVIQQIGLNALDTTIVIDTTGYISPSVSVNAYRFGAQINGLNDILYPNCNYYNSRDEKWGIHSMNLYPNPATSEVTIKFNHPLMVGEGTVVIQQADGRIVYTKTIDSNESVGLTIRVADWNAGVYQVRYQSPEGVISTAQLVVQ